MLLFRLIGCFSMVTTSTNFGEPDKPKPSRKIVG